MSDNLPEEALLEIFSRLPVKSLLRCRCLSKKWCSLIADPAFITQHLDHQTATNTNTNTNTNKDLLLLKYYSKEQQKERFLLYPDDGFPHYYVDELYCPFKGTGFKKYVSVVGSCNGILCLSDDVSTYSDRYVLWNPSVRRVVDIPCPNVICSTHGPFLHSLGFGFDPICDDYKLVRIVYLESDHYYFEGAPHVEVYSLSTGGWKMVANDLKYAIWERSLCAVMNGACHWLGYNPLKRDDLSHKIVSFDLSSEAFGEIAIPDCLGWEDCTFMNVAVFDGMLALVPTKKWLKAGDGGYCSVWVMKEYGVSESWTKLFDIKLDGMRRFVSRRKNGEIVVSKRGGELVAYKPETKEYWGCDIWDDLAPIFLDSFYLDTFTESLVLLNEGKGVSTENDSSNEAHRVQKGPREDAMERFLMMAVQAHFVESMKMNRN